jgi:hypothetical protein
MTTHEFVEPMREVEGDDKQRSQSIPGRTEMPARPIIALAIDPAVRNLLISKGIVTPEELDFEDCELWGRPQVRENNGPRVS